VVVVQDRSPIGRRYGSFFEGAASREGVEVALRLEVSPVADDLREVVARAQRAGAEGLVYLGLGFALHPLVAAMAEKRWSPPAVANSALFQAHFHPERAGTFEGWAYVDVYDDRNQLFADVQRRMRHVELPLPVKAVFYDQARLLAEAVTTAPQLSREGIRDGLERLKLLPAALGSPGTTMSFGPWDRAALKGRFLVMREWRDGHSVQRDD
jgi:ABC-type branched-subunit amino acid transport system substrate-binding protein